MAMKPTVPRKKPFPWHIVVFLAPAVLIYTVFMIYPLVDSLRLSFFTQDQRNVESFAGLQNYVRLLTDSNWAPSFWNAFKNNLIFFAALISIPEELSEAARMDGASPWAIFWRIKFPVLLPTVGIVSILTFVGNFNAFDLIYTVKGALAGPNFATDIMGTLFYRTF